MSIHISINNKSLKPSTCNLKLQHIALKQGSDFKIRIFEVLHPAVTNPKLCHTSLFAAIDRFIGRCPWFPNRVGKVISFKVGSGWNLGKR